MNAFQHARISAKRWGGELEDYYRLHEFIDSTKSLCSDGRHRILHTLWGVRSVVVPIFGSTLVNSAGKHIDIKDLCERDHLLVDYQQRFIPTLQDFVAAMDTRLLPQDFAKRIERIHATYINDAYISQMMLSPLALTGKMHSLLITHNSWFIYDILPRIKGSYPVLSDVDITPSLFFNAMQFEMWMDNGMAIPESSKALNHIKHAQFIV